MPGKLQKGNTHQGILENVVNRIFSENIKYVKICRNHHPALRNPLTGSTYEIDVWIPSLNLGFEFQDAHHYTTTWYYQHSLTTAQQQDQTKKNIALALNATLIDVPCWWDSKPESLIATIKFHRPELFSDQEISSDPIPINPPDKYFIRFEVPDIGGLMLASFPYESSHFLKQFSPHNFWWMGEKYDGIRFCWHPTNSRAYTRFGLELKIPSKFHKFFPSAFLDGEFWFGRGFFSEAQQLVHLTATAALYFPSLRAIVFDEASEMMQNNSFETRFSYISNLIDINDPFILLTAVRTTLKWGGEGVILRLPNSVYQRGRSTFLFKIKATRADNEALVVDIEDDGSYVLQLPDNRTFQVMSENAKLVHPSMGDVVTYTCDSYTRFGLPVVPKIFRVRKDITWQEVVALSQRGNSSNSLNMISKGVTGLAATPTNLKIKHVRQFFVKFARDKNFDPLLAKNWYRIRRADILPTSGAHKVLRPFDGSLMKALVKAFPEIDFDISKFSRPMNYYHSFDNRKKLFEEIAKKEGFDPLIADNWYSMTTYTLFKHKGAKHTIKFYNDSYQQALLHMFPTIGLDVTKFHNAPRYYWHEKSNRRKFIDAVAKRRGFDTLVPQNWYRLPAENFLKWHKGISTVIGQYAGSFPKTIFDLYPEIGLNISKFATVPRRHFVDKENRKKFFDTFAVDNGFDPLVADNWYLVPRDYFIETKSAQKLLDKYYKSNLINALMDIYPNIGLDVIKFGISHKRLFGNVDARREFLIKYAKDNNMDPLNPIDWYNISYSDLSKVKGGKAILGHYGTDVGLAVTALFPEIGFDLQTMKEINAMRRRKRLSKE